MMEYIALLKDLPHIASSVFMGLTELIDLYLLHAYVCFVDPNIARGSSMSFVSKDLDALIRHIVAASLSKHISIFSESNAQSPVSKILSRGLSSPTEFSGHFSASKTVAAGQSMPSHSTSGPSELSNSGNLYGFRERIIICSSLTDISQFMYQVAPIISEMLPKSESSAVQSFSDRVGSAAVDMRTAMLGKACSLLVPISWLTEAVAQGQYQLSEPPSIAAAWTQRLERQLELLSAQLQAIHDINKKTLNDFWDHVYPIIAEAIVQGLTQVKKCTLEGRAAMSLDLQAVTKVFQHTSPCDNSSSTQSDALTKAIRYIDDYIKGFYVPVSDLHVWAKAHPSYSESQVLALAGCIADSGGLRRKEIIAEVQQHLENM